MDIYAVWVGQYSDKSVVGVFSTEAKAQSLVYVMGGDARVQVYDVDPDINLWWTTRVCMDRNGMLLEAVNPRCVGYPTDSRLLLYQGAARTKYAGTVAMHYESRSSDADAAVKAANEIRTQLIALNLWPADMPIINHLWARSPAEFATEATWTTTNENIQAWFRQQSGKES